jgi:hypothetical protein
VHHSSHKTYGLRDYRCRISNSAYFHHERLRAQLFEQRFSIFKIGHLEAFGEPVVDFGKHRARFGLNFLNLAVRYGFAPSEAMRDVTWWSPAPVLRRSIGGIA